MITRRPLIPFNFRIIASICLLLLCLGALLQPPTAALQGNAASNQSTPKVEITTGNGVITADIETKYGRVSVLLPDDMAAGDAISGTVTADPKGDTPEEKQRNYSSLIEEVAKAFQKLIEQGLEFAGFNAPGKQSNFKLKLQPTARELTLGDRSIPVLPQPAVLPSPGPAFVLPNMGQPGRRIRVGGPFDGDLANTGGSVGSRSVVVLAESPRQAVFQNPQDVVGQTQIMVSDQGKSAQGSFRNIEVRLTAPKTALIRGEKTTVTIEVSGLEGLEQTVPMDLNCSGAVDMSGGNQQNTQIKPADVKANGTFTQTRQITGKQAGVFNIDATVKINNQPCQLTGQIVHVQAEPFGGNEGIWKVKIKLQNGNDTEIVIQSPQKPDLRFCNWIRINSCRDGVVPAEDRHGYDKVPQPPQPPQTPQSPDPKTVSNPPTSTPTPTPRPSPSDPPRLPSTGCTPPAQRLIKRDTYEPIHIVDEKSEFKLEITIVKDTKGRQEAQDLAAWFRGVSNLGGLLAGKAPRGGPGIGMSANVAALIFAELDAGADILDAASRARLTSIDPTKFKIAFEVETTLITPYCDTWEVCKNGVWVIEKRYGQSEAKSKVTITKSIEMTSGDWGLISSGPKGRFDPEKADDYARGLIKGVFAGLGGNKATLATAQTGCK
jgi:hypothetical protein